MARGVLNQLNMWARMRAMKTPCAISILMLMEVRIVEGNSQHGVVKYNE